MDQILSIYVNKKLIDIGEKSLSLNYTIRVNNLADFSNRVGSFSKTIKVPRTKNNDEIFNIVFYLNSLSNEYKKWSWNDCEIELNDKTFISGFIRILDVSEFFIDVCVISGVSSLKVILGEKNIQDLDLSDLDHEYTYTNVINTWINLYPLGVAPDFYYPLIDYNKFNLADGDNDVAKISDLRPAVYIERILKQIILETGYTLKTYFFDKFINKRIAIPFTNENFVHSKIGDQFEIGVEVRGDNGDLLINWETPYLNQFPNKISDTSSQFDLTEFISLNNFNAKVTFQCRIKVINPSVDNFCNVELRIDRGSGFELLHRENIIYNGDEYYNIFIEKKVTFFTGDKLVVYVIEMDKDPACETYISTTNVFKNELLIQSSAGTEIKIDELVNISPNLPDMKQIDFILNIANMFNMIIDVDNLSGIFRMDTYDDYYNGDYVDWSEKIDLKNIKISYSDPDIPNNYIYKYDHDDDVRLKEEDLKSNEIKFGDGKYLIGNDFIFNKKNDKTVSIGFSPTVVGKSFYVQGFPGKAIFLPQILRDSEQSNGETNVSIFQAKPRIIINAGLIPVEDISGGYPNGIKINNIYHDHVNFSYFTKWFFVNSQDLNDLWDQNLCFQNPKDSFLYYYDSNSLFDSYHKTRFNNLKDSTTVEVFMKLNTNDIVTLDFSKFIWIDYFKAYFILEEVRNYNPLNDGLTLCVLKKVNYNG